MTYEQWEREIFPKMWRTAYDAGVEARKQGLPRTDVEINLWSMPLATGILPQVNCDFCTSGGVLKVYKSAWEQGWDGYKIPEIFKQVESVLNNMPLHKMTEEELTANLEVDER